MTDSHTEKFESMLRLWGAILCHVDKLAVAYRINTNLYIWTSDGYDPTLPYQNPDKAYPIQHVDTATFKRDFEAHNANWTVYALTKATYPEEYKRQLLSNIWPSSMYGHALQFATPSELIGSLKESWFTGLNAIKQQGISPDVKSIRFFNDVGKTYEEGYDPNMLINQLNYAIVGLVPDYNVEVSDILSDSAWHSMKISPGLKSMWMSRAITEMLPAHLYQRITPIDYSQRNIGMANRTIYLVNQELVTFPYGFESALRYYLLELDMLCRGAARGKKMALLRNIRVATGKYTTSTDDYIDVTINISIPQDAFNNAVNGVIFTPELPITALKTSEYCNGKMGSMKFHNMPESQVVSRQKLLELHNDDPLGALFQTQGSTEPRKQLTLE